jgi:hypothetical protein
VEIPFEVCLSSIHPSREVTQECGVLVRVCLWGWSCGMPGSPIVHQPRPGMSASGSEKVKNDKNRLGGGVRGDGVICLQMLVFMCYENVCVGSVELIILHGPGVFAVC